jgi:hypothetical protein
MGEAIISDGAAEVSAMSPVSLVASVKYDFPKAAESASNAAPYISQAKRFRESTVSVSSDMKKTSSKRTARHQAPQKTRRATS